MDKFEVYNRSLNTWQDKNISSIQGWSENFVKDKTTDSGKVKLKYKGLTMPNWENGDWCRFLHINEKQKNAHLIESADLDAVEENEEITIQLQETSIYKVNEYIVDLNGNLGLITSVLSGSIKAKRYFVNGLPIVQSENGATYQKKALVHTQYLNVGDFVELAFDEDEQKWGVELKRAFNFEVNVVVGNLEWVTGNLVTFNPNEIGKKYILSQYENPHISSVYSAFSTEYLTEYNLDIKSIAHIKYNEEKTGAIIYLEKPLEEDIELGYIYYSGTSEFPVLNRENITFNAGETIKEVELEGILDNPTYMPEIYEATPETIEHTDYIYIPLNHEQYIIQNPTMVEDLINNEIDIQLDLGEPIEIAQGIICETHSHTNQIEKKVDIDGTHSNRYLHRALTHYSVLKKELKLIPSNNDTYADDDINFSRFNNKSWFNRIKIDNSKFLDKIPFNDETYNEPKVYDILLNKYDSSTGRTPVLYFDINGLNDKPYNQDRTEYVLTFERQDGLDKEEIELEDLTKDRKQLMKSKSFDNYAKGVVSNFDNLAPNTTSHFVSENLWAIPEIDSAVRDIDIYGEDSEKGIWVLKTPHLIKKVISIDKLEILATGEFHLNNYKRVNSELPCLEFREYRASNSNYDTRNCAWYEEGKNLIHLNDYYYEPITERFVVGDTYRLIMYKIQYEPLISGRTDDNKDYETIINQVDGQIDSEKFGKYLNEYLASMNKADLTISKTVEKWEDIAELGSRVVDGNKTYLITSVGIQQKALSVYEVVYQLNENHFRRSDSIVAPQEIRKNIEIGIETTKERKSTFPVNYNLTLNRQKYEPNSYFINRQMLFSSLIDDYNGKENNYPQIAYFNFKSKLLKDGAIKNEEIERLCELSRYNLGNSICFNMRYIDNAEAGKYKKLESAIEGIYAYIEAKYQEPILFTDYFGEFNGFDFKLLHTNNDKLINIDLSRSVEGEQRLLEECAKTNSVIASTTNYPLVNGISTLIIQNPVLNIDGMQFEKDMLDTFNWTFAIKYGSDKQIIYCRNFFKNSILMTPSGAVVREVRTYNRNMQEEDFEVETAVESEEITSSQLVNDEITISLADSLQPAKSIAIVDTNGNPVIIINDWDKIKTESFNEIKLYC